MLAPADAPDIIWTCDAQGNRVSGRPNFDKPGVAEKVACDALEADGTARGFRSTLDSLAYARRTARQEESPC